MLIGWLHFCHFISHTTSNAKFLKVSVFPFVPFSSQSLFSFITENFATLVVTFDEPSVVTNELVATLNAKSVENNV